MDLHLIQHPGLERALRRVRATHLHTLNGVKKHVGILETVDLVVTAKVGRARECRLGPAQLEDATGWIDAYRRAWERRLDRFGTYVEERR